MPDSPDESWSTRALLDSACALALGDVDESEPYHAHTRLLQRRDPAEVWSLVVPLATSETPALQSIVPDVLRYLGGYAEPRLPLLDETVALLRAMLARSPAPEVIARIGLAFIDLGGEAGLEMMLPFVGHESAEVRSAVVHALLGLADARAIEALITLSNDGVDSIRDWATFGLGSQLGSPGDDDFVDSEAIRAALVARLDDADENTRAEAAVGLASRGDRRALPAVLKTLSGGPFQLLHLDAARDLADPALGPALRQIAEEVTFSDPGERERLEAALAACRDPEPGSPVDR
jgi:HEAT repeat protein